MLSNRIYYWLKPVLPWRLRTGLKRWRARRIAAKCVADWPIKESAGRKPAGWPGWPEGRPFAFVLTHDVESQTGVDQVRQLAELEMSLGFRSSFNFIPEGTYRVPAELRRWLEEHGFEVGVHDLHHDGKLYWSRAAFQRHARRINHYFKDWGAVGFRAGFMLHNLDWIHDLEVLYDASTFDTDPFEPQPDGVGTIFPFWVPARQLGKGYVELPYTLVQDASLFLVLREKTIQAWKRKLDWIARQGGMALLNTHPDYMDFDGKTGGTGRAFPVAFYEEFLGYVRSRYAEACWPVLPREVARFCAGFHPSRARHRPRRICMLSYSFYENDNRVRRYAETLTQCGDWVDSLAVGAGQAAPRRETINGVEVYRLQNRTKNERNPVEHFVRIALFCWRAAWLLRRLQAEQAYDLVHVHNVPDFLVFAAWFPRRAGARVILDIHDIVPEFYASKFSSGQASLVVRALKWVEKAAARFADHVIVSNHLWYEKMVARSVPETKASVFVNHVDPRVFFQRPKVRTNGKFILAFPGSLGWHQGVDIAIRAMAIVGRQLPEAEFRIYGDGGAMAELIALTEQLGLQEKVRFLKLVPHLQVPEMLANVDLGLVPKRNDPFGGEAYSTKIMEFMSQGVPVIVSRTRIDSYYFDESVVCFFEPENADDLAERILALAHDKEHRDQLAANGLAYVRRHSWDCKKMEYLNLVESLTVSAR